MKMRFAIRHKFNRRFCADERGATAVEFGLISIPFMAVLLAIFQTGLVFFHSESIESAVAEASRAIMTGEVQSGTIQTKDQFRDQLLCSPTPPRRRILPSFIDCTKLVIDVQQPASFANADMARGFYGGTTTFSPGGASCISVVRVAYPVPVFLPFLTTSGQSTAGQVMYQGSMKYVVQTAAVFRNEPFSTSNTGC